MKQVLFALSMGMILLVGCQRTSLQKLPILTSDVILADLVQNVGGSGITVKSIIPNGVDLHSFSPSPQDVKMLADAEIVFVHGRGLEEWLEKVIVNSGTKASIVEVSKGLSAVKRNHDSGMDDSVDTQDDDHEDDQHNEEDDDDHHTHELDPHFWMDPTLVVQYIHNIERALSARSPQFESNYKTNAKVYIDKLTAVHDEIQRMVDIVPVEKRIFVTDHDSLGYFADQYGFKIVGSVLPSISTGASPNAKDVAKLIDTMKNLGVMAIFTEKGFNQNLVEQISKETGAKVFQNLSTHSFTDKNGISPDYISLIRLLAKNLVSGLSTQ